MSAMLALLLLVLVVLHNTVPVFGCNVGITTYSCPNSQLTAIPTGIPANISTL